MELFEFILLGNESVRIKEKIILGVMIIFGLLWEYYGCNGYSIILLFKVVDRVVIR